MHLSEKAQRWTRRGRENQRGCASGGCVCNCSISITFDIIIPGLKKKKKKKEGVDFKAERWIRAAKLAKPQRRAAQVSPALKELQTREAEP